MFRWLRRRRRQALTSLVPKPLGRLIESLTRPVDTGHRPVRHGNRDAVVDCGVYTRGARKPGTADFVEILASNPADAVRAVVAQHPGKRFNIVNVTTP